MEKETIKTQDTVMKYTMKFWERFDSIRDPKGGGNPRVIRGMERISKDVVDEVGELLTQLRTETLKEEREGIQTLIREHGQKMFHAYNGKLPYVVFGEMNEKNKMKIYLQAHEDILKDLTKDNN